MIKNNLWNRIFHSKELSEQTKQYETAKKLVGFGPETLQFINGAKDLVQLLDAHKIAWNRGYQNENLGPCEYGRFRTKNISDMTIDEVYLGDIYGLWTFNIREWNKHSDETMAGNGWGFPDDTKVYDIIMRQYRTILRKNVEKIIYESKQYIKEYETH